MSFRILHTADWHLGKTFHDHSLIEDQKNFLAQIKNHLTQNIYDALVVSGDIFDRENPPREAFNMFGDFLHEISEICPDLAMFFIKGNHDSTNFGYPRSLIRDKKIYISVDETNLLEPVILEKGGEKLAVYQFPFMRELCDGDSFYNVQQEIVSWAVDKIKKFHSENYAGIPILFSTHVTALGHSESEYDANSVGFVEGVNAGLFSDFVYTALGHIHKTQKCSSKSNVYYSGAPLLYYFDANPETCFLDVTVEGADVSVKKIPFKPLHPVLRINDFTNDYLQENVTELLKEKYNGCYLEFVYKDPVLPENSRSSIKKNFKVLSFRPEKTIEDQMMETSLKERSKIVRKARVTPEELFDAFFDELHKEKVNHDTEIYGEARNIFSRIWKESLDSQGEE